MKRLLSSKGEGASNAEPTSQSAPDKLRVLLAQVHSEQRKIQSNVRRTIDLLEQHKDQVDLAVFPELFLTGYQLNAADELQIAVNSSQIQALQQACSDAGVALVTGFIEAGPVRPYNSLLGLEKDGSVAGVYRKTHLYDNEALVFEPGKALAPMDICGIKVGPLICFDIELPEPARWLAKKQAQIHISIAANMSPYYSDHKIASQARALENRLPHIYVNSCGQVGQHHFVGGSRLVDSAGTVISELGASEAIQVAEIEINRNVPPELDYLKQLRPELYT